MTKCYKEQKNFAEIYNYPSIRKTDFHFKEKLFNLFKQKTW